MRNGFIFYKSFYDALREVDGATRAEILDAICQYSFDGKMPQLTGVAKALWMLIEPQLRANEVRYENGKKGGAPSGNQNARKNNQKTTEKQPKNNLKTTEKQPKEKEKEKVISHSDTDVSSRDITRTPTREELAATLITDETFAESAAMQMGVTTAQVKTLINQFNGEQDVKQTTHDDYNDYRRHAYDWIRIQVEKQKNIKRNGTEHIDNIQRAQREQLARINEILARDGSLHAEVPKPF